MIETVLTTLVYDIQAWWILSIVIWFIVTEIIYLVLLPKSFIEYDGFYISKMMSCAFGGLITFIIMFVIFFFEQGIYLYGIWFGIGIVSVIVFFGGNIKIKKYLLKREEEREK